MLINARRRRARAARSAFQSEDVNAAVCAMEAGRAELLEQSDGEKAYEELWKRFVDTITIRERENGGLQQQLLPLKFRKYMTEWG